MAVTPYRIVDEPAPGRLAGLTVAPLWPMLAWMLAGSTAGCLWFALNAWALGGSTKLKEQLLLGLTILLAGAYAVGLLYLGSTGVLSVRAVRYLAIALPAMKMIGAYSVYLMQERSFGLYSYYGGKSRNGVLALIGLSIVSQALLAKAGTLWTLVLR